jgi:hypothetical protein
MGRSNPQFALEQIDVFMVLAGMWSNGAPAPVNRRRSNVGERKPRNQATPGGTDDGPRFTTIAPLMFVLAFVRGSAWLMLAQENTPHPQHGPT